jgi:ADP-ribose pyrophosphatase YjhB (NUDIX family)
VWEDEAKHCPVCAELLTTGHVAGRERPRCPACSFVLYKNPAAAALGVVLDDRGRVLLVRRKLAPFRDHWTLPAGYQDVDEEPRTTVVREVREETGVTVEPVALLDLLHVHDERKPANVAVYLCRPVAGEAAPGIEETDVGWFALDALPHPLGFDNYPRILARLRGEGGYPESPWNAVRKLLSEQGEEVDDT